MSPPILKNLILLWEFEWYLMPDYWDFLSWRKRFPVNAGFMWEAKNGEFYEHYWDYYDRIMEEK
jgi:hypothetical protein